MKDKKIILLIVLAVFAIFSLIYGILAPPPSRGRHVSSSASGIVPVTSGSFKPIRPLTLAERYPRRGDFKTWGPNPFSPKEAPKALRFSNDLTLNGIAWDPKNPSALVNDQVVVVGDEIEGNKVVAINKNNVVLNNDGKEFKLEWGSGVGEYTARRNAPPKTRGEKK